MHILKLCTEKTFRNQGVGKALLDCAFLSGIQKGAVYTYVEVRGSNKPAKRLYEKCGFRYFQTRKNYYPDTGEDAIILLKILMREVK